MGIIDFEKSFALFASKVSKWAGSSLAFSCCRFVYSGMGHKRTLLWLLGELANGREYRNHNCYFSHGLCDPE